MVELISCLSCANMRAFMEILAVTCILAIRVPMEPEKIVSLCRVEATSTNNVDKDQMDPVGAV